MRTDSMPLVAFAVVSCALASITQCSSTPPTTSSTPDAGLTSAGGSIISIGLPEAAAGSVQDASDDTGPAHPLVSAPDGGPCSDGDASSCALPPSVCADQDWLAYFDDPMCMEGQCQWTVRYRQCPGRCSGQGCAYNGTL